MVLYFSLMLTRMGSNLYDEIVGLPSSWFLKSYFFPVSHSTLALRPNRTQKMADVLTNIL